MLTIETDMPVALHPATEKRADPAPALQFLRCLNLLTLGTRGDGGDGQNPESGHEPGRLEAKIDMLMAMVGELLATQSHLPQARRVSLSAASLTVNLATALDPGTAVVVELYPSAELPRALCLPASVTGVRANPDGSEDLSLDFAPLDPLVRDELERYIFLRHRLALSTGRSRVDLTSKI